MAAEKPQLRIGLIGTGFMGKTHVFGLPPRSVSSIFPTSWFSIPSRTGPRSSPRRRRGHLGFARASGDWRRLVEDPEIDVIDITAPNAFHKDILPERNQELSSKRHSRPPLRSVRSWNHRVSAERD